MLLGLPYHVARIYAAGSDNFITSDQQSLWLDWMASFFHSFRMEAFFVIAGFFSYMTLSRTTSRSWLGPRLRRIALPLLVCTLCLTPFATGAIVWSSPETGGFWPAFARRQFGHAGSWVYHLWFLHSLLLFYGVLVAARFAMQRWRPVRQMVQRIDRLAGWLARLPGLVTCLLIAAACALVWIATLVANGPLGINLSPLGPFFRIGKATQFLPFFLLGVMLYRSPALFAAMRRLSWPVGLGALFAAASFASLSAGWLAIDGRILQLALAGGAASAGVLWTSLLLGLTARFLSQPSPAISYFTDASYNLYLVHLPIALWLGALLMPAPLPAGGKFAVVLGLTIALSLLCHEGIARSPLLTLLVNGTHRLPATWARARTAVSGQTAGV